MKRTTISWSHKARRDLLEIGDFIARDKPGAASRWVGRIIAAVEGTAIFPSSGRIVPEVDREDIREIIPDPASLHLPRVLLSKYPFHAPAKERPHETCDENWRVQRATAIRETNCH